MARSTNLLTVLVLSLAIAGIAEAQVALNPGDTCVIEAAGNTVPPGGITVSGGTLIIRDDAVFDVANPLRVSAGSVAIESNTTTVNVFDEIAMSGGSFDLQAAGRLDVTSGSIVVGNGVSFSKYHVYRGSLADLGTSYGNCRDDLDGSLSDTSLFDTELPASGEGFFYIITAENASGGECTLGYGQCSERTNGNQCP